MHIKSSYSISRIWQHEGYYPMHIPDRFIWPVALASTFALALLTLSISPAGAFDLKDTSGTSLHGEIIKEALGSTFASNNLELVITSCDQADESNNLFAENTFKRSLNYLEREQKKFLNASFDADTSPAARYRALKHFGVMLRIVQDFYSNSNFVERQAELKSERSGAQFDPYSLDLVEWSTLARQLEDKNGIGAAIKPKNNSDCTEKLSDSTYYKVAREMALRDTARQWDVLSTLIRNKHGAKAVTIVMALKEASVPTRDPDDD